MKLIRELPDSCTTQEILEVCDALTSAGHSVVIEHRGGMIRLYEESVSEGEGLDALRRLFSGLARDAPPADSPHWGEYEEIMRQLEAELRERGVGL
ncbi:MAG: hypothetical protein Q8M94_02815 [Ignavibacteria bacterium]|nr:hypothetical protein [Ignavibacteria bacterium]